jgi:nucleoside-diphosphate-sugar epimerase
MKYLVTGASGFIGRAFSAHAATLPGVAVVACSRQYHGSAPPGVRIVEVERYDNEMAMAAVLDGVDCVVHAAGRAHVMAEDTADPLAAFRHANVAVTARLARQAAASGVRRLVFLSSIGVNGESTMRPFTEVDLPAPASPYAVAKHEAEQALATIVSETNLEVVVVRPPLVTGPDAPGNFGRLVRLARSGIPLPFGGIRNRRSVVGIANLCEFLVVVSRHPAASNETFLVADPQDISTSDLIATLRRSMQLPPRLLSIPSQPVSAIMRSVGRGRLAQQLYGDLQVSTAKARRQLGWLPSYDTIEGLAEAVRFEPRRVPSP